MDRQGTGKRYGRGLLEIVVMGRACRNTANIKNRQPIGKMFVKADHSICTDFYLEIIEDELNVKEREVHG